MVNCVNLHSPTKAMHFGDVTTNHGLWVRQCMCEEWLIANLDGVWVDVEPNAHQWCTFAVESAYIAGRGLIECI